MTTTTPPITPDNFELLVRELLRLPGETTWVEFKRDNIKPEIIGKLISGLSNAATLEGKDVGWVLWGIENGERRVVGTSFEPSIVRKGNEELESWLVQRLAPRIDIRFHVGTVDGHRIVALRIPAAQSSPTAFMHKRKIRIGSTNRTLHDVPDKEKALWRAFDTTSFERRIALADVSTEDVQHLLDCSACFELQGLPLPSRPAEVLKMLQAESFLYRNTVGRWDITNLGAILFASDLAGFPTLERKAIRVVVYRGRDRVSTPLRERTVRKGYAVGFKDLIGYVMDLLPSNEVIRDAIRRDVPIYPDITVRELIVNALIHQDFMVTGAGPMVEIFEDRFEVTNPGRPLGDIDRLLDQPPRSRNQRLAAFMRRIGGFCEERGSGVDRIVEATEIHQLPPPRWEASGAHSRACLFAPKPLRQMARKERIHASYLHASLRHVTGSALTNESLRQRFGVGEKNRSQISRYIGEAVKAGLIRPFETGQARKNARYLPFWA